MASVANDPNEFEGFAKAAVAELAAATTTEGLPTRFWEFHLHRATVFAQLETAHQIEILRHEGIPTYGP